jgi:predicted ATPase
VQVIAGGNPLFVEEMLALLGEPGGGEVVVPATIAALLEARLDQLPPAERTVLECGSIEGQSFHQGTVRVMAPQEHDVAGAGDDAGAQGSGAPRPSRAARGGRDPVPAPADPRGRV